LRYDMKNLKPTVKHGNGLIVIWKCFLEKEVENINIIEGKVSS